MEDRIDELICIARDLWWSQQQEEAEVTFRRAVALAEQTYGPQATQLVKPLSAFAQALYLRENPDAIQLTEALALSQRALQIHEAFLGKGDPAHVMLLLDVSSGLWGLGRREEACEVAQTAVTLCLKLQDESESTGIALFALLQYLFEMERFAEALPLAEQLMEVQTRLDEQCQRYGFAALAHQMLGRCLTEVGRHAEAIEHLEKALVIRMAVRPENPEVQKLRDMIDEVRGKLAPP